MSFATKMSFSPALVMGPVPKSIVPLKLPALAEGDHGTHGVDSL